MGVTEDLDVRLRRLVRHVGDRGFTFDELARAATQVDVVSLTAVVEWLARARSSGAVEDMGFDPLPVGTGVGPRRYRGRVTSDGEVSHRAAAAR
jgi:hypothetical protein